MIKHRKTQTIKQFLEKKRVDDPPSLENGDINKTWNYKTIKDIAYSDVDM